MVAKTFKPTTGTSIAYPGYLSRIPDTDFHPSQIPDPTTATREGGKIFVLPFFVATNIIKLKLIFF
jgi:hypothetical protein